MINDGDVVQIESARPPHLIRGDCGRVIGLIHPGPPRRTYRVEFSLPDGEVTADLDEAELSVVWEASRPYLPPGYTEEELEAEWAEEEALRRAQRDRWPF
jgi:hypothetical protein